MLNFDIKVMKLGKIALLDIGKIRRGSRNFSRGDADFQKTV